MIICSTFRCVVRAPSPRLVLKSCRHASVLRRPQRPYTFTQLVTLSDGSTFTQRTTSPAPIYKATKDTRNTPLWNPSSQKLLNIEADEAGRLRAFRQRFGRGWDARSVIEKDERSESLDGQDLEEESDNLLDLISAFGHETELDGTSRDIRKEKQRTGKGKGGER